MTVSGPSGDHAGVDPASTKRILGGTCGCLTALAVAVVLFLGGAVAGGIAYVKYKDVKHRQRLIGLYSGLGAPITDSVEVGRSVQHDSSGDSVIAHYSMTPRDLAEISPAISSWFKRNGFEAVEFGRNLDGVISYWRWHGASRLRLTPDGSGVRIFEVAVYAPWGMARPDGIGGYELQIWGET